MTSLTPGAAESAPAATPDPVGAPGAPVGVIGGSGLYRLFDGAAHTAESLATPYGAVPFTRGRFAGRDVVFLARHGTGHHLAPHRIPYRANIWALAALGARAIVSSAAVGGLGPTAPTGALVVPDQYLDRTRGRDDTFYDEDSVVHLSSADPFCPRLRAIAAEVVPGATIGGTVAVIPGPRFSTRAESAALRRDGADLVNMTLVPEVPLAAELGMGTATLAFVTDSDDAEGEDGAEAAVVFQRLADAQPRIVEAIGAMVAAIPADYPGRDLVPRAEIDRVLARSPA